MKLCKAAGVKVTIATETTAFVSATSAAPAAQVTSFGGQSAVSSKPPTSTSASGGDWMPSVAPTQTTTNAGQMLQPVVYCGLGGLIMLAIFAI